MPSLPSGTVTFLFTDIEGSTKLWEAHPEAMPSALARHDALLHQAVAENEGVVFKTVGDAFCAAFATAARALKAAMAAHLLLLNEEWGETGPLKVRMGLHTGVAHERDGDYFGQTLNRVARLQAVGHGQQTLLSETTYHLVRDCLPGEVTLLDRGQHRLKDLQAPEHVWQALHPALPAEFPPLKSLDALRTNLPRQTTSFIGREPEIAEVKGLLSITPLLTLLGTGGAGKTRLALQVGAEVVEDYKDGVWLVELAALAEPALVPQTVASALGLREEPGRPLLQIVQDYLRDRCLLLILDNCEHLLNACAHLADVLLKTCPYMRILATSREALGIAGERSWRVPSLLTPDPTDLFMAEKDVSAVLLEYDACRLFVERALLHRQEFAITRGNASALVSVCRRLDGIPLAIELAAARVRSLAVEEIDDRLDQRFRLLTGGSRTALPRLQTLRAALDWSYDLLTSQERLLLARLAVFAGGWTLAAAEQVGTGESVEGKDIEDLEVLDLLTGLVDKSLVVAETTEGSSRYCLLETVRQYAYDRLSERQESHMMRGRHCDYFLRLAEEIKPKQVGAEQAHWLGVLEVEYDNMRQALMWCGEEREGGEPGLSLAVVLQDYWILRGHWSEGRKRLGAALSHQGALVPTKGRAVALNGAGWLAASQGDYASARSLNEESLGIQRELGDKPTIAHSLNTLGVVAKNQGDYASARSLYEESLGIQRELGNKRGIAQSLSNLGIVATSQGDYASARSLYEESLGIQREMGDKRGIAYSLNNLGTVAFYQGDYASARSLREEGLAISRELGDKRTIAASLGNLGVVDSNQGDYASARSHYQECLAVMRELGDKQGIALTLNNLGNIDSNQGDYASARSFFEEGIAISRELGDKYGIAFSLNNLGVVVFDQGDYASACALQEEGLAISRELGNKRDIADSLISLGNVAASQGDYASARSLYQECLAIRWELEDKSGITYSLEVFASLALKEGSEERSVRLWGAAAALRKVIGFPLPVTKREKQEREVRTVREKLAEAVFEAAWEGGCAMTLERAIEYALKKHVALE